MRVGLALCFLFCGCGGSNPVGPPDLARAPGDLAEHDGAPSGGGGCSFTFSGGANGTAGATCIVGAPIDFTGTKVNLAVNATTSLGPASAFGFGFTFHNPPATGTYSFNGNMLSGAFISGSISLNVGQGTNGSYSAASSGAVEGSGSVTITSISGPALDQNGNMSFTMHGSVAGTLLPLPGGGAMGMVAASGTF
jgi:hypothetical protein